MAWFSLVEDNLEPGWSLPAHGHEFHAETFIIREGLVRFVLDGDVVEAGPGVIVFVPPGTVHAVSVAAARLLMIYRPSGFDRQLALWAAEAAGESPSLDEVAFDMYLDPAG